jgi:hypothetical protein
MPTQLQNNQGILYTTDCNNEKMFAGDECRVDCADEGVRLHLKFL